MSQKSAPLHHQRGVLGHVHLVQKVFKRSRSKLVDANAVLLQQVGQIVGVVRLLGEGRPGPLRLLARLVDGHKVLHRRQAQAFELLRHCAHSHLGLVDDVDRRDAGHGRREQTLFLDPLRLHGNVVLSDGRLQLESLVETLVDHRLPRGSLGHHLGQLLVPHLHPPVRADLLGFGQQAVVARLVLRAQAHAHQHEVPLQHARPLDQA
mmetsp:Transcript_28733/g.89353  ORF Transcript_28733/g.89353 Transcript_28733/m.89353 type:complete len:207 (-) Transcript_28733:867-1487(-)